MYAHGKNGPRPNPKLTIKERDRYDNWILLCGIHHDLVDGQENTYSAENLFRWKENHEHWVDAQLQASMLEISQVELESVTRATIGSPSIPSDSFVLTPPTEKMDRNRLTDSVRSDIVNGLVKAQEVERYVQGVAGIDRHFPERLRAGFISHYQAMKDIDLEGDQLFREMWDFAANGSLDFDRRAAGLAVLVYLFQICDLFES